MFGFISHDILILAGFIAPCVLIEPLNQDMEYVINWKNHNPS